MRLGLVVALIGTAVACTDSTFKSDRIDSGTADSSRDQTAPPSCTDGQQTCSGQVRQVCQDGEWSNVETCPGVCSDTLKRCADCEPSVPYCSGDDVLECDSSGQAGAVVKTCRPGECLNGFCQDPCSQAEQGRGYVGCEYWPTVTTNSSLVDDFSFAVVVSNPQTTEVEITVTQGNQTVATAKVAAGGLETITLPWVEGLKNPSDGLGSALKSTVVQEGAYRLVSSLPVTVYQFNPLDYQLAHDCEKGTDVTPGDGKCFSYTNDASLLLPAHVLGTEYMVISSETRATKRTGIFGEQLLTAPGFFSVVATKPGTTKVDITFAGDTQVGMLGIAAFKKGDSASFNLNQWDVLQILSYLPTSCTPDKEDASAKYCNLPETNLTGTRITSDKPVALYGGHDCAFIPYNVWACDHLEEQIFPLQTWGRRYIATHTQSSGSDPALYRVVSAADNNMISFTNSVHQDVTLQAGQTLELTTDKDFEVNGTERFALMQFMVGQNYAGPRQNAAPGDPAMALAVPVEQFRKSYGFLAPQSFEQNYVNVIAPADANVTLDGNPVTGFTAVAGSDYQVAKVPITGGSHSIEGTSGFGIAVYGVGSYTSYMYPGGLDLKLLQ